MSSVTLSSWSYALGLKFIDAHKGEQKSFTNYGKSFVV